MKSVDGCAVAESTSDGHRIATAIAAGICVGVHLVWDVLLWPGLSRRQRRDPGRLPEARQMLAGAVTFYFRSFSAFALWAIGHTHPHPHPALC